MTSRALFLTAITVAAVSTLTAQQPPATPPVQPGARFTSGVELINVTATVSDASGRFVPGLRQDDFVVYEDGRPQDVTYFSAERVPVSLGLVLDTSGSMAGDKIDDAKSALDRFVYDLLDERDELFLYRFSDHPVFVQGWTSDRALLSRAIGRVSPDGGTAMYDAVLEALPLAATGRHAKKALVVISDGNDTSSIATLNDVRERLRGSEVLVYAVGIDGDSLDQFRRSPPQPRIQPRPPNRFPPGGGRFPRGGPGGRLPFFPQIFDPGGRRQFPASGNDDRVNVTALRDLTDDSGGRTEIVRTARDLNPATASIADELSKQYAIGYVSPAGHDGQWHSIRVELRNQSYRVRARRGYVAS
ncbi:MAG: VWA domain-containing protein [Vicinamibacterales bacterium]